MKKILYKLNWITVECILITIMFMALSNGILISPWIPVTAIVIYLAHWTYKAHREGWFETYGKDAKPLKRVYANRPAKTVFSRRVKQDTRQVK